MPRPLPASQKSTDLPYLQITSTRAIPSCMLALLRCKVSKGSMTAGLATERGQVIHASLSLYLLSEPADSHRLRCCIELQAWIAVNLTADLQDSFTWNTRQIYLWLTAEYATDKNQLNQAVFWNWIIESKVHGSHIHTHILLIFLCCNACVLGEPNDPSCNTAALCACNVLIVRQ